MMQFPAVTLPVSHVFAPGLYIRTIFMPAGTLLTSKIHKTRHSFMVTRGLVQVINQLDNSVIEIDAREIPFMGFTEPGTRRVLRVIEDTIWSTFHVTDKTTPEAVEADIIEVRTAHLEGLKQPLLEQGTPP